MLFCNLPRQRLAFGRYVQQHIGEKQQELKKRGLNPIVAADDSTSGPAFLTLVDPDGNPVLIDQHVPKLAKK